MTSWEERITHETPSAIRAEHELRYRMAAPIIAGSAIWADLGCGNGVAAAAALSQPLPERVVLVDLEPATVARAAAHLNAPDSAQIDGDLTDPHVLERIGRELSAVTGERVVTCFEVVEHLATITPLLEWAGTVAREGAATFVLSVPNDAFWAIENPYHQACWGEGAFEELRRLLPPEHTLLRQTALTGSVLVQWDGARERHQLTVDVGGEPSVASHFIAAFGPRHSELQRGALAVTTDQNVQRRWERQRDSNLAVAEARLAELSDERSDWREYIHELERELGRPLSGVDPEPTQ